MSLFNWFSSKKEVPANAAPESSGLWHADATVPQVSSDRLHAKLSSSPVNHASNRKTERLERRELLYSVVRDTMIRAGVLAASYKFKVLSLDARGRQYLIMMDLAHSAALASARLAEIEAVMAQAAKAQHDILVTAVYWRVNEPVIVGLSPAPVTPALQASSPARERPASRLPLTPMKPDSVPAPGQRYEALQEGEVAAFKRALASATPVAPAPSGKPITSGRRNPAPPDEFADTQLVETGTPTSPLSATQYGDLN
jgi:hypothetical protein